MPLAALQQAVDAALADLDALAAHPEAADVAALAATIRARLARPEVVVAAVGEARAGKTTFLEAVRAAGVPEGFRLLDTAALNTDDPALEASAWAAIREEADAVLLVSDLQQAVSRSTREALAAVAKVAPHVLLVLTKADRARANAELAADPAAEVAEAERVAIRRFAAEIGRDPADVLAVAVAAGPALRDEAQAAFFRADLRPMWEVLRAERDLALAGRAAAAVEAAEAVIRAALGQAAGATDDRIARLEAQRLPDPAAFRAEATAGLAAALADPASWDAAAKGFRNALARAGIRWEIGIRKGIDEAEVREAAAAAGAAAAAAIAELAEDARQGAVEALAARAADAREEAIAGLRARYRLAGEIAGDPAPFPEPAPLDAAAAAAPLEAGLDAALAAFDADRGKLQLGGAAAGAAVGTAIAPGLGTAVGALLGSLGGLFMGPEVLKDDLLKKLKAGLDATEARVMAGIREGGARAEAALAEAVGRDVDAAIAAVAGHVEALLAAERARLDEAHAARAGLTALGERLAADLAALRAARQAAAAASRGLVPPRG